MAIVAGVTTSLLAGPFGWRSVFVLGAVATAILVRLNRILVAIGHTRVEEQPRAVASCRKVAFTTLFSGCNAVLTVLDWIAFTAAQTTFYFASSWTPHPAAAGGSVQPAGDQRRGAVHIGSVSGAVLLGVLAQRIELRRLTGVYLTLAALALVLYSPGQGSSDGARHRTGCSPPQRSRLGSMRRRRSRAPRVRPEPQPRHGGWSL